MQEEDARDLEGTRATDPGGAGGLLEDPNRVVIGPEQNQVTVYAHGVAMAILEKHINSLELAQNDPLFVAAVLDFESLYWTHTGALLRLQGDTVYNILGPSICVLRGQHRPVWSPRPGLDHVRVVVPREDPRGLSPVDVFQLAISLGF
jgi:hypothetical protein